MLENKELWERALSDIELAVSSATFKTWFRNTRIVRQDDGTIFVGVPNVFFRDWLANKYHKIILKALRTHSPGVRGVEYTISREKPKDEERTVTQITPLANELPLADLYIDKKDNLNPRYTFENFVSGPFNEVAFAAGQAVIRNPGLVYNPILIHGGTGLGKTHLTQAIGNTLKKTGKKVYYIASEKFSMEYVAAVHANKQGEFKEKYAKYDVFIIDDIQFLVNKKKTQEEMFHLFNALYENNRQIVLSSDQHPNFLEGLEDRLKSRFTAGMVADIAQPEYESRLLILKQKSKEKGISFSDQVLDFLATSIQGNIREIEGVLNTLMMQGELKGRELTLEEVRVLIKNTVKPKKNASVKDIVRIVAGFYEIEEGSIYEKTRKKEIVKPRQIIMYLLREHFSVSYPTIGQKLGGRDHTTVMHSCEKVKQDLKSDPRLYQELEQIRLLL